MSEENKTVRVRVHEHTHSHPTTELTGVDEQLVMLEYMLTHNEHHMEEFINIMEALREDGRDESADLLQEAIDMLEDADVKIADAVDLLRGGK